MSNDLNMVTDAKTMINCINISMNPIENQLPRSSNRVRAAIAGFIFGGAAGSVGATFLTDANTDGEKLKKINEQLTTLLNARFDRRNSTANAATEFMQNVYRKEANYTETAQKLKKFAGGSFLTTVAATFVTIVTTSMPVASASTTAMYISTALGVGSSIAVIHHSLVNGPKLNADKKLLAFNANLLLAN